MNDKIKLPPPEDIVLGIPYSISINPSDRVYHKDKTFLDKYITLRNYINKSFGNHTISYLMYAELSKVVR